VRPPIIADETLVKMDMAIDEARQYEATVEIKGFTRRQGRARIGSNRGNAAVFDGYIDDTPIGQPCILKQCVDLSQLMPPKR
jgi:hypothetical protein